MRASIVALVMLTAACGDAATTTSLAPPPVTQPLAPGWRELPPGPLSPREDPVAFWTGTEVLIIGGSDAPPCPAGADCTVPDIAALRDGAAFDPATGAWRAIAPAPVPIWLASGAMVDGVVYLWADGLSPRPATEQAFLAYHADEDRWERLPSPDPVPKFVRLAPAGDRVTLYQPSHELGIDGDRLFDPANATWSELPPDPLQPAFDRFVVWTGDELVLVGIELASVADGGPALYAAARYDPVTAEWRRLPDSEVAGSNPTWYLAGPNRLVNPTAGGTDGGQVNNYGQTFPFGGLLDLAAENWSPPLPQPTGEPGDLVDYAAAGGGVLLTPDGRLFDAGELAWAPAPAPPGGAPRAAAVVWAGDDLVVWGGTRWATSTEWELLDAGWAYRPAG